MIILKYNVYIINNDVQYDMISFSSFIIYTNPNATF